MRALAGSVSVAPEKPGFSCFDPTLAQRLTQAADQAEQPAELKLREAAFSEGPAGVANAVKDLWKNIGAYTSSLASYVASGGKEPFAHTSEGQPITGRDLIALLAMASIWACWCWRCSTRRPRRPPVRGHGGAPDPSCDQHRDCTGAGYRHRMGPPILSITGRRPIVIEPRELRRGRRGECRKARRDQLAGCGRSRRVQWPESGQRWAQRQGQKSNCSASGGRNRQATRTLRRSG
jgi:hypothetical protein